MISSVCFFLLILPLLTEQSTDGDGSLQQFQESRRNAKNRSKLFTCYQGDFNGTENARPLTKCVGKMCARVTHIQTGLVMLFCKNVTELDESAGQCRKVVDDQLPGQTDEICLCEGNLCNGVGRLKVPSLFLSLSVALAVPVLLRLLRDAV